MPTVLSDDQKDALLKISESHFYEVKGKEIAPAKLSRAVSALANASGGEIYVGISESPKRAQLAFKWDGFESEEAMNPILQVLNDIAPLADFVETTIVSHPGSVGMVLKIEIRKNATIVFATDGKAYVRRGAQNLAVTSDAAMERLRLDKGVNSYEDYSVNIKTSDIENSEVAIEFLINVVPTAEPEIWLRKQLLIKDEKPTVAGVLLFSEEPQAALPKRSGIKLFRYTTADDTPTREQLAFDPLTIEGSAYSLIFAAVKETQRVIEEMRKLGTVGMQQIEYPPETLHEIITNAVLHRDYSVASDVQIRVFDNRVEVESPGRLAGHVTTDNILDTQFARNQRLVRIVNKFPNPPNKDVGEGLNTAFDAMRKLRLKEPMILENDSSVVVVIPHQRLASPEDIVLEYLETHEEIVNREARKLCGINSENTMKGVFKRLEAKNIIEKVPGRSRFKAAWRLVRGDA